MKSSYNNIDPSRCLSSRNIALLAICFVGASIQLIADDRTASAKSDSTKNHVIAYEAFDYSFGSLQNADHGIGWKQPWRVSRVSPPTIVRNPSETKDSGPSSIQRGLQIRGTGDRNNPLRRELRQTLSVPEVFVRFTLHYVGDQPPSPKVDPEFFVLWLDRLAGGDRSTHAANVPNIGVHVADRGPKQGKNVFMIRIGPARTAWSKVELQKNQTYQVVGRLSKSQQGVRADYDRFEMWVDPKPTDRDSPDATLSGAQSISLVKWIGFSTGKKTEATDRIHVSQLVLGRSWQGILDASATRVAAKESQRQDVVVWNKTVDFKRDVYPLLKSRCFDCHSGPKPESGYRLDIHRELMGYSTGEVLAEPGRSLDSRLIKAIGARLLSDRMPPDGNEPLNEKQIAMLRAWIDQGMKWDDELLPPPKRESDHWAFQTITRPEVPQVDHADWLSTPVDAFIARAHAKAGLRNARKATRRTLVRRLYLDLIGLPPIRHEANEFLNDRSPLAYERLVERLLRSPHYGERWARYWLDLARWAESHGFQHDIIRPNAWRYRDYVINSFNNDKPYDRFLKEQIAGDELQPYSDENLIATGFLGAARISGNQEDRAIQRNDVLVDIVNVTGSAILGLTLECAQCHNHKFDPVSQRDYYRLRGFFVNGQLGNLSLRESGTENRTDVNHWTSTTAYNFYAKEVKSLINKRLYKPIDKAHTWGYLSAATGDRKIERFSVVNRKPIIWQPSVLKNTESRLLVRGDVARPGPKVGSGWPEILGIVPSSLGEKPRSALADWLADSENPLVSRVWVNRLWQYHFGRGLVATPSDFGVKGAQPTHPELLDWLASELMDKGWSTKHIHRQIVMSSTYQQERNHDAKNAAIDPDNKLLWRWPRRRLEAESIRDSVIVATGEIDRSIGGLSIPPEREETNLRRTIYLFQQRSDMPSVMEMFDAPNLIASCSRRAVSTVALQPLFMLNSQFMANRASKLAAVVSKTAGENMDRQIEIAFERTLARKPDDYELKMARKILQTDLGDVPDGKGNEATRPLMQLCHALLNLNEFVYIP